ncbi:Arm DNA-binding domain-containing protein [Sutterella wadsworthensis]|uniref:Arm DNA-binding domain-containing protein n=1 Tax=Sutterella wadsworthensis TaxID=40545 RepID=UPI003079615A
MPKIIKPLTSKEVVGIFKIGLTTLGGDAGLMLLVKPEGARYFVYRFQMDKKWTMISFGAVNAISLKQARESAAKFAEMLRNGIDPVEGRRKQIEQQKLRATRT